MRTRTRTVASLGAAALVLMLAGCGSNPITEPCDAPMVGSKPNCSCPAGTSEPDCKASCTQTTVLSDSTAVDSGWILYHDFSVPDSGRLDVTLDWTHPASEVGFYLVPANTCTTLEEFNARKCNFLIQSEPSSTKPRRISTPNFAAGNYRWLIANFSKENESTSLLVVLSKGAGCPALAGGSPAALSDRAPALPPLRRMQAR